MFGWLTYRNRYLLETNLRGFSVIEGHRKSRMDWQSVTQIDVGRKPTAAVEHFYVTMSSEECSITVTDSIKGFGKFQSAAFEYWPQIKSGWVRVFTGPSDILAYEILWKRQ